VRVPAEALSHLGESELDDAFVGAPGRERRVGENRWQYHIVPAEGDFEQRDDFVGSGSKGGQGPKAVA